MDNEFSAFATTSTYPLPTANPLNLSECPEGIYSDDQRAYRVYANAPISLFGIVSNLVNIVVFADYEMRQQLVNHFLLALSISDLLLLLCNFFFLVLPVLVVETDSFFWNDFFPYVIRYSYPLALTVQTSGVYLTMLVSVHRFLGVCHPFKAKRWVTRTPVECAIIGSIVFSFAINIPTWLELGVTPCYSVRFSRTSRQIQLAAFHDMTYILVKKCLAYTILMFIVPFATLIIVNWKMVVALRMSTRMRKKHTYSVIKQASSDNIVRHFHLLKSTKYSEVFKSISKISYSSILKPSSELFKARFTNSTRDRSITFMLLAIVGLFLLCNGLAFLNSIVESLMLFSATEMQAFQEAEPQAFNATAAVPEAEEPEAEDWMQKMVKWFERSVEISNVLITLNSSTSTLIYLIFSSKYRMIFKAMFGLAEREKINRVALTTAMAARRVMELSLIPEEVENRSRRRSTMRESEREDSVILTKPPFQYRQQPPLKKSECGRLPTQLDGPLALPAAAERVQGLPEGRQGDGPTEAAQHPEQVSDQLGVEPEADGGAGDGRVPGEDAHPPEGAGLRTRPHAGHRPGQRRGRGRRGKVLTRDTEN